jgi:uncharacterized protein (DUF2062 family)
MDTCFRPVVVAPTFNNGRMLRAIVMRMTATGMKLIVVNDGSTDETSRILDELIRTESIEVIHHNRNRGKGAALQTGFARAHELGYTHAISVDTDGQLDPGEIPALIEASQRAPLALVLGSRDEMAPDYPSRSRLGRRASNLLVRMECGLRVSDSQCGFRVYPLELIRFVRCRSGRYGFETEILTRAGWAGAEVREVPVSCTYGAPSERISHFQPWRDSFRALGMHLRLLARAILPWGHRKGISFQSVDAPVASTWKRALRWIDPAQAWRDLRAQRIGAQELATGVAIGVFIGNLPVYGVQTLLSLYTARRLHLHPLAVVTGSHVSTPPAGPVLIAIAIGAGHWMIHGSWMTMPTWQQNWSGWVSLLGNLALEWTIGAVAVGFVLAIVAFVISHLLLSRLARQG